MNLSPRAALLCDAEIAITGDRNNSYGPPTQDFARTADAANAYGYRGPNGQLLQPHDVAILIGLVKISRLMWSPRKRDNWLDLAGYAACGWECALSEEDSTGNTIGTSEESDYCGEDCEDCARA